LQRLGRVVEQLVHAWAREADCFGDLADRGPFWAAGARIRGQLGTRFRQVGGQEINPEYARTSARIVFLAAIAFTAFIWVLLLARRVPNLMAP